MYRELTTIHRTLKIYGPSDKRDQLEPQLIWATPHQRGFAPRGTGSASRKAGQASSASYASATAAESYASQSSSGQRRGATSAQSKAQQETIRKQQEALQKAAELKQMLSSLEKVDDEGRRASLLDTLCSVDDILKLPVHPNPPGVATGDLVVDLLKHQVGHVVYKNFVYLMIACRAKHYSGASTVNTLLCPLRIPTCQSNFGSTKKLARR
jgi:SWI/SNF-related matrix-associated actin-dependent regulator of chromatin subfamily A3